MANGGQEKIYEMITGRIITALENGKIPWEKPWIGGGRPMNLINKKEYRGSNVFILGATSMVMGYESRYWVTYNQAQQKGGQVKRGEKSTPVVFWKFLEVPSNDENSNKKIPLLRYYSVFNLDQCEGIEDPELKSVKNDNHFIPIEKAQTIIDNMPKRPTIEFTGNQAFYSVTKDKVVCPKHELFNTMEDFYGTIFHELAHSTGHKDRLNRQELMKKTSFGSMDYSKEELVAELTAAFLCGEVGIDRTIKNSAAYIQGWLVALENDKRMLIQAGSKAQKAADFILDRKFEPKNDEDE